MVSALPRSACTKPSTVMLGGLRSRPITRAPCKRSRRAVSAPIPEDTPVTTTVLFCSFIVVSPIFYLVFDLIIYIIFCISERISRRVILDRKPLPLGVLFPVSRPTDAGAVTGDTRPAERIDTVIIDGLIIDVNHPLFEATCYRHGAPHRCRNHSGRQATFAIVGQCHRLILCLETDDTGNRAKNFFIKHAHSRLDTCQYGRLVEQLLKVAASQ